VAKRSTPAAVTDRRRFRISVKFGVPPDGLGRVLDELHSWLTERLGRDGYAILSDTWEGYLDAAAVHLDEPNLVLEVIAWLERVPAVERIPSPSVDPLGFAVPKPRS
jgi:hypothetical protein